MPQPKDKDWLNGYKTRPLYMLSTRDQPQNRGHIQTESEGLEKDISWKWRPKKAGVSILISDKIDCETKPLKTDKEEHYIMIKGSIQEEDITIIKTYAPRIGVLQYVKQMLTSIIGEIKRDTIIVGDFNTTLTPKDRSTKPKMSRETQTLNDTMNKLDLNDIYRTFHPQTMNFTFISSAQEPSPG